MRTTNWECVNYVHVKLAEGEIAWQREGHKPITGIDLLPWLPHGRLSLPVRFQVIRAIASIAMYFSYHCNPISASVKGTWRERNINKQPRRSNSGPAGSYMMHSDTSSLCLHSKGQPFHVSYSPGVRGEWNTEPAHTMSLSYPGSQMFADEYQACHMWLTWRAL